MKLKEKINKKNIMAIKSTVSEIMEKKNELQLQIQDFKDNVEEIKTKKDIVLKMVNEINPKEPAKMNKIWKLVQEKKNKR